MKILIIISNLIMEDLMILFRLQYHLLPLHIKDLENLFRFSGSYNIRSERTGQHFEDYSNCSYVKVIDIPSEVLLEKFKVKNLYPEHIQIFTKKNQFKLLKYMRYKWIEKNGLEITDPKD